MHGTNSFLRLALLADAASSGAMGILLGAGAGVISPLLGLPVSLLRPAGLALLPFAAFVAWLGTREAPQAGAVWLVIAVNALWVLDSLVLLAWPALAPTTLGIAFVLVQALAVAGLTAAQIVGLRSRASEAAAL